MFNYLCVVKCMHLNKYLTVCVGADKSIFEVWPGGRLLYRNVAWQWTGSVMCSGPACITHWYNNWCSYLQWYSMAAAGSNQHRVSFKKHDQLSNVCALVCECACICEPVCVFRVDGGRVSEWLTCCRAQRQAARCVLRAAWPSTSHQTPQGSKSDDSPATPEGQ